MVPPPVDFMEISARLQSLPTLAPRPTATNINAFEEQLVDILSTIPSAQSEDHGFRGLVESVEMYAITSAIPWRDWPNPGPTRRGTTINPHPTLGQNLDSDVARAEQAVWVAETTQFMSETNVRRAIIDALNTAVPKSYRRAQGGTTGIGHTNYKATNQPRDILAQLRTIYGRPSPGEKEVNDNRFKMPWQHGTETIEELFNRLEECYVIALRAKPAYTVEQLVDKAVTSVQLTGLYPTALLEWNGFAEDNKTWPEMKSHFTEAYDLLLTTGGGTAGAAGYHGANYTADNDDDSMTSITASITNMHIANNANAQAINDNMSTITAETRELRALVNQLAMMAQGQMTGQQPPAYQPYYQPQPPPVQPPPTQSAYNMTMPPTMATPPQQTQQTGRGGRGGRTRGGRGRGGGRGGQGGRGNYSRGAYGQQYQPPATMANVGNIPPPPGGNTVQQQQPRNNAPNPVKYFNNWNMCCNCGYDIPVWHTSQTCPYKQDWPHHNNGINRTNAKQYEAAGWKVSRKGIHKTQLPTDPHEGQA